MPLFHFDHDPLAAERVDAKNGVIYGVTVITSGREARGHSLHVDDRCVKQMFESAMAHSNRIPSKLDHGTGVTKINGYLTNFRIEGPKLKADWELLKEQSEYKHTLELCQKMSDIVGLSASFTGEGEDTPKGKAARCTDLISVDFVTSPAVNVGLFSAKHTQEDVDTEKEHMSNEATSHALLEKISSQLTEFNSRLAKVENFAATIEEQQEAALQEAYENGLIDEEGNPIEQEDVEEDVTAEVEDTEDTEEGNDFESRVMARLNQFESHFAAKEDEDEQETILNAFAALEQKITELTAQRDHALSLLEQASVPHVNTSIAGEKMFSAVTPTGGDVTQFEQLVSVKTNEFSAQLEPKTARTQAISFVVKNHPEEYQEYLATRRPVQN